MKKTLFLIIGLVILVLIIISLYILFSKQEQQTTRQIPVPSPITIPTETITTLQITETNPPDKQSGVPINYIPTITFNKNISLSDIVFTIQPPVPFKINTANNQAFITFSKELLPETIYTYTVAFSDSPVGNTYSFTTASREASKGYDNATQHLTIWSRANKPDLFLYNKSPHKTMYFSLVGTMKRVKPYDSYFDVTLLGIDKEQSKQEFINWLLSLGLTQEQIDGLDIRY